jgi:lantibiotic modifying enzyme
MLESMPQPATDEEFLRAAIAIAEQILAHRIQAGSGSFHWFGPHGYGTPDSPLRFTRIGPYLYNGTVGIALFLAALGHVTGEARYMEASLQSVAPLRRKLLELVGDPVRASRLSLSVGGLIGLGSLIYAFLKIGQWLEEPALFREAHAITNLITQERIAQDDRFRFQKGSAGGALALLALHRMIPEKNEQERTPLDLALTSGEHLVKARVSFEGRPRAWLLAPGRPPVCGFCYGTAGIRYALLRLHLSDPRPELWDAAEEALAYERSLYSPEHENWLDTRFPGRRLQSMWCHGTAGLVLGKIATLPLDDSPEIRDELKIALAVTLSSVEYGKFQYTPYDDLCCGHMGRVEVLHYAAQELGNEDLMSAARDLASWVAHRAGANGGYGLTSARGTDLFDPCFFQGASGIGYTFLRLASRKPLPCVLLLE